MNLDLAGFDALLQEAQTLVLAYRKELAKDPVCPGTAYEAIEAGLEEPLPRTGQGGEAVLAEVTDRIIPGCTKVGHPRFLAWMNNASCDAGILGEIINAGLGQVPFTVKGGKSVTAIEHLTGRWFREIFGLPADGAASFTGGGTLANLTALSVARETIFPGAMQHGLPSGTPRLYMSEQGHVSIDRAAGLLGLGMRNITRIGTGAHHRIDPGRLEEAIQRDAEQGARPFCVVAQAGSAATGAVDDLETLADICARHKLWLHVDAAYGGAAILTDRGRGLLKGIERADSITADPHKWFYMPVEAGLVLFRQRAQALETFLLSSCPSYRGPLDGLNLMNQGLQIAQASKAFKLWFALKVYGLETLRACIDKDLDLAAALVRDLAGEDEWEVLNDVQLSTVCLRYRSGSPDPREGDALQHRILDGLEASGSGLLSAATVNGRAGIRICFANHRTQQEDVRLLMETLTGLGRELCTVRSV